MGRRARLSGLSFNEALIKTGQVAIANQMVEGLAGLRDKFDPAQLIASVATAAIMNKLSPHIPSSKDFAGKFIYNEMQGIVHAGILSVIDNQKIRIERITASALGAAIGQELGQKIQEWRAGQTEARRSYEEAKKNSAGNTGKNAVNAGASSKQSGVRSSNASSARVSNSKDSFFNAKKDQKLDVEYGNNETFSKVFKTKNNLFPYNVDDLLDIRKALEPHPDAQRIKNSRRMREIMRNEAVEPVYPEFLLWGAVDLAKLGYAGLKALDAVLESSLTSLTRRGFFAGRNALTEKSRLLSSVERVSSGIVNKDFIDAKAIASGWKPPYPENVSLRKIVTAQELKFYRVHVDPDLKMGRFLAREKEIMPLIDNPEALRLHLGLPETPLYVTEVNLSANTELLAGRIGAQPNFGLMKDSGFQYQLAYPHTIPKSSFGTPRLIVQPQQKLGY